MAMSNVTKLFDRRASSAFGPVAPEELRRPPAPVGVPLGPAHLRADHRRRRAAPRSPRPRRSTRTLKGSLKTTANIEAAKAVGKLIAERAVAKGIKEVAFDRGGYMYHGRVKALADAAREGGLSF